MSTKKWKYLLVPRGWASSTSDFNITCILSHPLTMYSAHQVTCTYIFHKKGPEVFLFHVVEIKKIVITLIFKLLHYFFKFLSCETIKFYVTYWGFLLVKRVTHKRNVKDLAPISIQREIMILLFEFRTPSICRNSRRYNSTIVSNVKWQQKRSEYDTLELFERGRERKSSI